MPQKTSINQNLRDLASNPLLTEWRTPFAVPPFQRIDPADFRQAFEHALAQHRQEIEAIAADEAPATFDNVLAALERSGRPLRRISAVFFNLCGADTNPELEAVERDMAPVLAGHYSAIHLNEALWLRLCALRSRRDHLTLDLEQERLLDRYLTLFERTGAALEPRAKKRLAEISERLAALATLFSQNVLADERTYMLVLESERDLAGLPDFLRESAARTAADRGLSNKHVITLSRSSIEPFLQFSQRRDLREQAFRAWIERGQKGGETDNREIIAEIVRLRAERARLLGYESYAHYRLADTMAKTPQAALRLLDDVWRPARATALADRDALQAIAHAEGGNASLAPWDWRYYTEKRRQTDFDLREAEIKPYLQLDRLIAAAFDTARRLFDLNFTPRSDVPVYHPDVRVWEVTDSSGRHVGIFMGDYFARGSKRSGAWCSVFRTQQKLSGDIRPIVVNVMNFSPGVEDSPSLLSLDDARTLFHEFGHGLHCLLSDVTYPMIAGTAVTRDFVEFPSQLFEHWLYEPATLQRFAVHYRTGKPMPETLIDRILKARTFNQGFALVEYLASALVDMDLHLQPDPDGLDIAEFESAALTRIAMPDEIAMRHRLSHFAHLFAGEGYAAGYYSYLWSEVLDADGFAAFEEAGDIFDPETARRLREFVYAAGNLREPDEAYRAFRGRDPEATTLLKKRGLSTPDHIPD